MPNRNWDLIRRLYDDSEVTGIDGVTRRGVIEDMKEACAYIAALEAAKGASDAQKDT